MQNSEKGYLFQEQEFDLKKYLYIIFTKRWILISVVAVVMLIDAVQTFRQIPIYRATSLVLIEKPQASLSMSTSRESTVAPAIGWQDYYNTQYEILKSRILSKRVVRALSLESLKDFKSEFPENIFQGMIVIEPIKNSRLVRVSVEYRDPVMAAKMTNTLTSLYIEQNIESMLFMSKEILKAFPEDAKEIERHTIYGQLKDLSRENKIEYLPSVVNNPTLQQLRNEKISIEAELANLSKRYKSKHPKIVSLNTKLKFIDEKISAETERVVASLRADIAGRLQANNIRVVDYAEVPSGPIRPQKVKNMLIGLFISVFLGLGVIFLTEYLDDSIKTQEDVEEKLRLPYIGEFPLIKNRSPHDSISEDFAQLDKINENSEAIRNIKTNIIFSMPKEQLKTILFTSALPKEGKSFLAGYIAYLFGKSGFKTLVIDADLRKPRAYKLFEVEKTPGLVNLLIENLPIDEVIKKSRFDNLYVLASGSKTPNPLELLSSDNMHDVIKRLAERFDKIVVDTPPCFNIADALVLSKISDLSILITKHGAVSQTVLDRIRDKFSAIDSRITGVIINFSRMEHGSYYKYRYYHKYYKEYYSLRDEDDVVSDKKEDGALVAK